VKKALKVFGVMLLAIAILVTPLTALAKTYEAKVYSSRMNVYSTTSTNSEYYLGCLSQGTIFTVHDVKNGWAKVSYRGNKGYAQFKDIIMRERHLYYVKTAAPVYTKASSSSKKLMTLPVGTEVYMVGRNGDYWLAQNKNGSMTAYIHDKYVTTKKVNPVATAKPTANPTAKPTVRPTEKPQAEGVEYAVWLAEQQLGKPYSEHCSPPDTFDCAFLIYYCYRSAGINVNDSAYSIGYDKSMQKITDIGSLKRGDIVCFNTNGDDDGDLSDHVGIYLGNGKFIHASSAGGKVMTSSLSVSKYDYYERNFSWGLRP